MGRPQWQWVAPWGWRRLEQRAYGAGSLGSMQSVPKCAHLWSVVRSTASLSPTSVERAQTREYMEPELSGLSMGEPNLLGSPGGRRLQGPVALSNPQGAKSARHHSSAAGTSNKAPVCYAADFTGRPIACPSRVTGAGNARHTRADHAHRPLPALTANQQGSLPAQEST